MIMMIKLEKAENHHIWLGWDQLCLCTGRGWGFQLLGVAEEEKFEKPWPGHPGLGPQRWKPSKEMRRIPTGQLEASPWSGDPWPRLSATTNFTVVSLVQAAPLVLHCYLVSLKVSWSSLSWDSEEPGGHTRKGEARWGDRYLPHSPLLMHSFHLSLWAVVNSCVNYWFNSIPGTLWAQRLWPHAIRCASVPLPSPAPSNFWLDCTRLFWDVEKGIQIAWGEELQMWEEEMEVERAAFRFTE